MATKRISSLAVQLVADVKKYQQGMEKAQRVTQNTSKEIKQAGVEMSTKGAFALAAIQHGMGMVIEGIKSAISATARFGVIATKTFVDTSRELDETIKRARELGLTTSQLQQWQFAADLLGVQTKTVTRAMKQANRRIGEALLGYGELAVNAKNAAISIEQFRNKTTQERFTILIDQLSQMNDRATQAAVAYKFGGRSLTDLLNIINSGRGNLNGIINDFHRLSLGTDEMADKMGVNVEDFLDNLRKIKQLLQSVKRAFVITFSGALGEMLDMVINKVVEISDFFRSNFKISGMGDFTSRMVQGFKEFSDLVSQFIQVMGPEFKRFTLNLMETADLLLSLSGEDSILMFLGTLDGMLQHINNALEIMNTHLKGLKKIGQTIDSIFGTKFTKENAKFQGNFNKIRNMQDIMRDTLNNQDALMPKTLTVPKIASAVEQGTAAASKLEADAIIGNTLEDNVQRIADNLDLIIESPSDVSRALPPGLQINGDFR